MATDFNAARRQIADLPESADKHSMLEFLAREEELETAYHAYVQAERKAEERLKTQIKREKAWAFILGSPIASFFGFYLFAGLRDGRIKNFVISGQVDYFSVVEFPYVSISDEPYLYGILVFFYALLSFAFGALALGIEHFGRKRPLTRAECDAMIETWKSEQASGASRMVEVGSAFGQKMYSPRVDSRLAFAVIALLLTAIAIGIWQPMQ